MSSKSLFPEIANRWKGIDLTSLDVSKPEYFERNEHSGLFARLRRESPVHYCPQSPYGPYWSVCGYDDIVEVERNHQVYSSENNVIIGDVPAEFDVTRAFATADPPIHTQERRAVLPAFTRKRLDTLADSIREKIRSLLEDLPNDGTFDWVQRVSNVVTNNMVGELFDLSAIDRERLPFWCEALVTTPEPGALVETWQQRDQVIEQFRHRLLTLWAERRRDSSRSDVISALAQNPDTVEMSTDALRLVGTVGLIAGANEAARAALSGAIVAFNQFPDQWHMLKENPELIDGAVAEIVRWQTPIIHMRRTTTEAVQLGNCQLPPGARVVLWYCSANRDESQFENPELFDMLRPNANKHLGYGSGIHRCLGQHVAEMELRILLRELLQNPFSIKLMASPQRIRSNFSANYQQLLVRKLNV